ncbi:MAG TPA: extensin family protein [Hyphomicrobiaceae bacterium]|nr:extensin family protein [Hyphomicrobiaceae bacterium]
MYRGRVVLFAFVAVGGLLAWGCSQAPYFVAKYEPWREQEERACLVSGHVRESQFLLSRVSLGGPSACGALQPFEMWAAANGRVALEPRALLRCNMIPAVERWVQGVVEPAARYYYRVPVVGLKVVGSYSCRPINNQYGGKLSEHGHANAIDIAEFRLADGRRVSVREGWYGDPRDRAFLRSVHSGACREFTTVLGPDNDRFHHDHFHLDLARRGSDGNERYCK